MRGRRMRRGWLPRQRRMLPVVLAVGGGLVGLRLLAGTYILFQHAYLGSYWAISGAQVGATYWASVRFAFEETALVGAGLGVLASLTVLEVGRAIGR